LPIVLPLVPGSKPQTHETPAATAVGKNSSFAPGEGLNNNAASHVSLGTVVLFKITHSKKSTLSPVYHDLPPLFWWEGLDGSAWVDDLFDDLRKRVRQCGPGQFLGGLKLDLGNFNTEFFEGRNR
jgi:hypothetical protein